MQYEKVKSAALEMSAGANADTSKLSASEIASAQRVSKTVHLYQMGSPKWKDRYNDLLTEEEQRMVREIVGGVLRRAFRWLLRWLGVDAA